MLGARGPHIPPLAARLFLVEGGAKVPEDRPVRAKHIVRRALCLGKEGHHNSQEKKNVLVQPLAQARRWYLSTAHRLQHTAGTTKGCCQLCAMLVMEHSALHTRARAKTRSNVGNFFFFFFFFAGFVPFSYAHRAYCTVGGSRKGLLQRYSIPVSCRMMSSIKPSWSRATLVVDSVIP